MRVSDLLKRQGINITPKVPNTPVTPKIASPIKKYGTYGRLEIPELSISVPVYKAENGNQQKLCDDINSAVCLNWGSSIAIVDHCDQANFSNLNYVKVGQTVATVDQETSQKQYRCIRSQVGHLKIQPSGNRLYDSSWTPVYNLNPGGLTIYTCLHKSAADVMDVRLTYWMPF